MSEDSEQSRTSQEILGKSFTLEEMKKLDMLEDKLLAYLEEAGRRQDEPEKGVELGQDIKNLEKIAQAYFDYILACTKKRAEAAKKKDEPRAVELKDQAWEKLEDLHVNIIKMITTRLKLNRYELFMRGRVREQEQIFGKTDLKDTGEIEATLNRHLSKRARLQREIERLKSAQTLLDDIEPDLAALEKDAAKELGEKEGETLLKPFLANMRKSDFDMARKKADAIEKAKSRLFGLAGSQETRQRLAADARKLADFFEKHKDALIMEDPRIYLRSKEADLAISTYEGELDKAETYIAKYYIPYLISKVDIIVRLKSKLATIGSPESLLTLHRKIIRALCTPMTSFEQTRDFENDLLMHLKYMSETSFREIDVVLERGDKAMSDFMKVLHHGAPRQNDGDDEVPHETGA